MVLSVSFLELGQSALSRNDAWLTIAVVRTTVIDAVVGGWSCMIRLLLEDLLFGPLGLATAGLPSVLDGMTVSLFAKLTNVMGDGDGLRQAYSWRGATSLKPCLKHFNVLKKASNLAEFGVEYCEVTSHAMGEFKSWPTGEVGRITEMLREANRRVSSGDMTMTKFEELQVASGFNFNPDGLLASRRLADHCSLIHCVTYDWVHTLLQDGVFVVEAALIVKACGNHTEVRLH